MLLSYELFVRRFGLRKPTQLMNPIINKEETFKLPKCSIYHFVGDGKVNGPSQDDPIFPDNKRVIPIYHVTELESFLGKPRLLPGQPQQWIREFQIKNRRFRKVSSVSMATRDPLVPFVVNYSLIDRRYRYIQDMYADYNRWFNLEATILHNTNEVAGQTSFQNFIFLTLPEVLPTLSLLNQASKQMNITIMKKFGDGNSFMIFEFWKWLGEERDTSLLKSIEPENYSKINFVFKDSGNWVTFNLGTLNSWRIATKEEREANPDAPKKGFPPKKIQKLFLRYLMSLASMRAGGTDILQSLDKQVNDTSKIITKKPDENKTVGVSPTEDNEVTDETSINPKVTTVNNKTNEVSVPEHPKNETVVHDTETKTLSSMQNDETDLDLEIDDTTGEFIIDDKEAAQIEDDLEAMEKMVSNMKENRDKVNHLVSLLANDNDTPEESIMKEVDDLADSGTMTAAEYRRYKTLATRYKEIIYPSTNKTLENIAVTDKKALNLEEPKPFKDSVAVFDKSMLESSIHDFDEKYIKETMNANEAGVILSMQKAGICVTDIEKERVDDATGSYDTIRIKTQPVVGAPSTLWMKLPVIDDEGNFTSNGTKYRIRKQRGDLPIRKIAPNKVTLTSYYGKATVIRSNKKVTDYGEWLRNNIMAMGLDMDDNTVQELKPSNAFNPSIKVPRLYSLLGMRFSGFKLGGYEWVLDYKEHTAFFTPEELNTWEKNGSILVGKNPDNKDLLLMDSKSYLYTIKDLKGVPEMMPTSTIEGMLGLDRLKAPVDITTIKVLGKIIPIGFLLAYHLGLEKLIDSLGVSYRRVPKDGRLDMRDDEWRLVFGDESLIFSRDDVIPSMILAGLKDFHRELLKYSVYEFDRKDVYLNLLEAQSLSPRYLREIDLMFKMFVDPITKDILEEMDEPTSFMGLLTRATELLVTDENPGEVDPRYTRTKGFERIPGAMYNELVKAIRVQNGRVGRAKVPIDLNPYAVWRTITSDPAVVVANEINPIQNLKESEAVTYGGNGGRTSQTMVKHTREYHKNDLGTVSEATVDSSDVGINIFLSTNPNFKSVYGISKPINPDTVKPSSLFSTSFLMAPGADMDDKLCVVLKPL